MLNNGMDQKLLVVGMLLTATNAAATNATAQATTRIGRKIAQLRRIILRWYQFQPYPQLYFIYIDSG
jgi:hypothetical protein